MPAIQRIHEYSAILWKSKAWKPESNHKGKQSMYTPIQAEFRPAIQRALKLCKERFGESLIVVYLGGSVAFGEALAGVSDADWWMFQESEPNENDKSWCRDNERMLIGRVLI